MYEKIDNILFFIEKYYIVLNRENEIADMLRLPLSILDTSRARRWLFMVKFLLFLILGFLFSITINVALLCIIYIMWTNKQ